MPKQKTHKEFIDELKIIRPDITTLENYVNSSTKIRFRHNCGYEWDTCPTNIINGKSCPLCGNTIKKTQKQFEDELFKINDTIKVIGKYVSNNIKIDCLCLVCNNVFPSEPANLLRNHGCPFCSGRNVSINNCIITTHPYIEKYLVNINDGYKYSAGSHKYIDFKCPDCSNIRNLQIKNVLKQGFSCPICSDGVSYPNKFARAFLSQLPITNLTHEYSTIWSKRYRYDNYFIYNNQAYILEMDGEFHYKSQQLGSHTLENQIRIDNEKDRLASENGIKIIRIDCRCPNFEYIKSHIIDSELSIIFDLSDIDWILCEKFSVKNYVKEVCDYYQENKKNLTHQQLSMIFHIDKSTVERYLKVGKNVGWVNEDIDTSLLKSYQISNPKSKSISVLDSLENKLYDFKSINLCAKQLTIYTGIIFNSSSIKYAIKNKNGKYKNYIFKYN